MMEEWDVAELHCFKSLRSNAELFVRQSPASKEMYTEADETTKYEVIIRQPVKTKCCSEL
jgi:hypothetical protein